MLRFYSFFLFAIFLVSCAQKDDSSLTSRSSSSNQSLVEGYVTHLGQTSLNGASGDEWSSGVFVDTDKSLYFCGSTQSALNGVSAGVRDFVVGKLNANGSLAWITQYDSSKGFGTTGEDNCRSITIAGEFIYVSGFTNSDFVSPKAGSHTNIVYSKLDKNGNIIWTKQITQSLLSGQNIINHNQCWSIVSDNQGGVYLGCHAQARFADIVPTNRFNALVFKIDSDGEILWATQLGENVRDNHSDVNAINGNEIIMSLKVDNQGNLYAGGYTTSAIKEASAGNYDAFVMKLNANDGNLLWLSHLGQDSLAAGEGTGEEILYSLDIAKNGDVYFSGTTKSNYAGLLNPSGNGNYFFGSLDKDSGSLKSLVTPSENTNANMVYAAMKLDSNDNVYLNGYVNNDLLGPLSTGSFTDGVVLKYKNNGELIWGVQFNEDVSGLDTTSSYGDYTYNIAVDDEDSVYISGGSGGNFYEDANNLNLSSDFIFIKLNRDGNFGKSL